jgi:hypothetical protein
MPQASHRLSLFLVPRNPDDALSELCADRLLQDLRAEKVLVADGRAGPNAEHIVAGGFVRFRIDRPPHPVMYGNRLGGYRAQCPSCGVSMVQSIEVGLRRWRAGDGRALCCPRCQAPTSLEGLDYAPPAAPAHWALVFSRVESSEIHKPWHEKLESMCGVELFPVWIRG